MHAILTVFRKEMIDHLRDRRSILVAMIYPLMGPLLLGLMFTFVGGTMRLSDNGPLVVPIVNFHSAPDLVRYLEKQGAAIQPLSRACPEKNAPSRRQPRSLPGPRHVVKRCGAS